MAAPLYSPEETRILLQDESAGKLPDEVKSELATLRSQKLFPPPLSATPFQRTMAGIKERVRNIEVPGGGAELPPGLNVLPGVANIAPQIAAELIPGNEIEAGAMLATAGAGGIAAKLGLKGVHAALARIFGGTLGGTLGGLATGEPGRGAAVGAVGTAAGELAGAAAGPLRRMMPGGREKILTGEAAELAGVAKNAAPALKPAGIETVQDLFEATRVPEKAKYILGDALEQGLQSAENKVLAAQVPPGMRAIGVWQKSSPAGWRELYLPALDQYPMSLRDAAEKLKDLWNAGWGPGTPGVSGAKLDPLKRGVSGDDARKSYRLALHQVQGELYRLDPTGEAFAAFDAGRKQYSVGMTLIRLLSEGGPFGAFRPITAKEGAAAGVMLHTPQLNQNFVRHWGELKNALPPQDFNELVQVVYRGAPIGSTDVIGPGQGHAFDALRQVYGQGRGGTPAVVSSVVRTGLPGAGDAWAGRKPLELSAKYRTLADLLGIVPAERVIRGGEE